MILKITVGDNDFTEALEEFAKDPELVDFVCAQSRVLPADEALALFERLDRFRELFYNTEKYTPELITELCEAVKYNWELYVKHVMPSREWWDEDESDRIRGYLIRDFKVKFQKSLTPKWRNDEVVYICLGYHNRWWTF